MIISKEWLSEFVDLNGLSDAEIAQVFTLRTAEVEGLVSEGENLAGICVGVIQEIGPHPKADRLRICVVDVGEPVPLQIVCGGSNLEVGQKVALARIGARVQWHGESELITLEPAEIRGVKSDGMICGADEIGLSGDFPKAGEKEILDLSFLTCKAGTPLAEALQKNNVLIELDNKALSNRPDLWGLRGLAREFGAVLHRKVTLPNPRAIKTKSDINLTVSVENSDECSRYQAAVVTGVAATPSPLWLQKRLSASGVRPINALVDVTNYVMLECGQPLHAFDFDTVKTSDKTAHIYVRSAKPGEKIDALDGKTYDVPANAIVVGSEHDVIAVAGVIGGNKHAVSESTKTVIIESAHFAAGSIRQTSTRMRVRTESSSRFEKGLDANNTELGLARAIELLMQIFPQARVSSKVVDHKKKLPTPRVLELSQEQLDCYVGGISLEIAKKTLEQLGFVCKGNAKKITVTVPTFRLKDINGAHDLIEEVVRLYGYEKIPSQLPKIQLRDLGELPVVAGQYRIKELCAFKHGLTEVHTYAYVKPQTVALFGFAPEDLIELANPLSSERPYLAPTLAMNLSEVVEKNQRLRETVGIFEIAKVFSHDAQPTKLAIALCDKRGGNVFARVREIVYRVCGDMGHTVTFVRPETSAGWWKSGASAAVMCEGFIIGHVALLNPTVQHKLGIENETAIAEIDLSILLSIKREEKKYTPSPEFQASVRDIAIVVDEQIAAETIIQVISDAHPLVRHAEIFDIFRGQKVGENKKAVAIHITYRAADHTLTGEELSVAHAAVTSALEKKCSALIR